MLTRSAYIPLFPLNVVLFPGMMLPLHIFEKRYQAMVKACISNADQTFGVILAKSRQAVAPGVANLYPNDLYEVGTTAHITAVEHLKDGRMNIITVGQERFVIKSIKASEHDYLLGEVDPFLMQGNSNTALVDRLTQKLKTMVRNYIDQLASASGEDLSGATLPADPQALAYLAGAAMQGPLPDKQRLLAADSLSSLIVKTVNVLDKENQILAYMLRAYQAHQQVQRLPFVDYSLN
jgi:Lon protease-like protein